MSRQISNSRNGANETDVFDLSGFVQIFREAVRHQKLLIFFSCLLTLAAVTWYAYAFPPIYRVKAQIAAEREQDPSRDPFYSSWQVFRKDDPRDEVQFFTSGPVLREVVERNNLHYDDVQHSFLDQISYMWRKSSLGKQYKSMKDSLFPDPNEQISTGDDLGETVDGLKNSISIVEEGDSNVATLTLLGPSRRVSVIANSLIDSYLTLRKSRHAAEAQAAFDVLNREAELARAELDQARDRREVFARENGLMLDFQKQAQEISELTGFETKIATYKSSIASLESSLQEINNQLRTQPEERVVSSTKELNPISESAKLRRFEQQAALIGLREKYREDSPEVREAVANIAKIDALIAGEPEQIDRSVTRAANPVYQELSANRDKIRSDLEGQRSALAVLSQTGGQMRQRLVALPALTATALDRTRDYDLAGDKYQKLLTRRMEAQVSATAVEAAPASVRVVDYAEPPGAKYWPQMKLLYPAALMAGLAIGLVTALVRVQMSGKLQRSHIKSGRISSPLYATIDIGGGIPPLTVAAFREKGTFPPANTPPRVDAHRSNEAGG